MVLEKAQAEKLEHTGTPGRILPVYIGTPYHSLAEGLWGETATESAIHTKNPVASIHSYE